jgi:hypothetical protein
VINAEMKTMVKYCCSEGDRRTFEDYYLNQCGHGSGMPVFQGVRMQRGHGIGNIFAGLFRSVMPLLKRIAPVIGRRALLTGASIAGDVMSGQSIKEAAKARIPAGLQEGIKDFFPDQSAQSGSGIGRKRLLKNKRKKSQSSKRLLLHQHHHPRDIFS